MFQSPLGGGTDSPQYGTDMPLSSQQQPQFAAPPVRVEVRHGAAPPVGFDVVGDEFVIGSVPGCDLRIPGANLPPQVCIIQRTHNGAILRKLAAALPILLNGSPVAPNGTADLKHGDIISVGAVDLHVSIAFRVPVSAPITEPARPTKDFRHEEWERKQRELEARAKELEEQSRELDADRVLWYERRQEIEAEIQKSREEIEAGRRNHDDENPAVLAKFRVRIEHEVGEEYRAKREELERMQFALREASVQIREKKQQLEDTLKNADPRLKELAEHEKTLEGQQRALVALANDLKRQRDAADSTERVQEVRLQQREQDLARREVDIAARELATRDLANLAEKDRGQYHEDLVRVDRLSVSLATKECALDLRALEIDERNEQCQRDARDFEEHLGQFDEREERAKDEDVRLAARKEELDAREARLNGRIAEIETQQTTLIGLRSKLERLRDELRAQESRVSDDRVRTEEEARTTSGRLRQVEAEKTGHEEGLRLQQERSALMSQAAERLRVMQGQIESEGARLDALEAELAKKEAEQAEQSGLITVQAHQLLEAQERLEADRLLLRERENVARQSEEARESLQEQLRLRSDEFATRQREMDERARQLESQAQELAEHVARLEDLRADANSARRLTDEEAAILAQRDEKMRAAEDIIAEQRRQLEEARTLFEDEQAEANDRLAKARVEIDELKEALSARTKELLGQMPHLEQRAQAALDRTAQAREAMRSQLGELHAYAMKSQDDLLAIRTQVQEELGRLREQEQTLNRAKSEHRLAVSSFRQQLIEWQGRFSGMKQSLHLGETRLGRREKEVEATVQELAERAEKIQQQEHEVTEKRTEVDRHLGDMQSWFRQKFREIAGTRWSKHRGQKSGDSGILQLPAREQVVSTEYSLLSTSPQDEVILPITDDLDPADRKLGELLRSLDIVDRDTLLAMWDESRRQRRTLRQVLLSGGYLTLYQLALIESGNLAGLMLGRFRVIDRLLSTPREAIYRVFDPLSRGSEASQEAGTCLLRHLGEAEMLDAVRPDEYRQRFGAARDLAHPNVVATLEVLDINGRPAVTQEWLHGLPGADWPAAVSVPGVWHRLMMQAALGLHAAHSVGLIHGRLAAGSFLLTKPGVAKLVGIGEPPWLQAGNLDRETTAEDDLRALGVVALGWMHGGRRKGVKPKPFPTGLLDVLRSLGVTPEEGGVPLAVYPNTSALLEDLDRAAAEVPSDRSAWDKLLSYVAENAGDAPVLRQSA
ncbi:MAG: hypothetical protein EXS09_02280 [Gemmataceae bacterium]|nr:hypothetical protein [Gemmataceae bacterium]